jgi:hypothetical protein
MMGFSYPHLSHPSFPFSPFFSSLALVPNIATMLIYLA